jgi:monoamine oxidase
MRTPAFRSFARHFRLAVDAERRGLTTAQALDEAGRDRERAVGRRTFVKHAGAAAIGATLVPEWIAAQSTTRVAIVGAGLAGLACADRLAAAGISPVVFEAGTRPGGRCSSLTGFFPGQVAERGGELIDNLHKTMIGYAKRFRLTLEDYEKQPGDIAYHFDGAAWPEATIVNEYRAFVAAMRADLQTLSAAPTADTHTDADKRLDLMSLADYLRTRGAGPIVSKAIEAAYLAEYGREIGEQSALNFLFFIHADKRSRFTPFGVFSDERYHVLEGNDRIAYGLAAAIPTPVRYGHTLRRATRTAAGRLEVTLGVDRRTVSETFDYIILAMPFSVLRDVDLTGLQLPAWKRHAIASLGYGTNAKMMIGFDGPYWRALGCSGSSYSDRPNHQTTWETNWTRATSQRAVLTDYASGLRGVRLDPRRVQTEAARFLGDLDAVLPGARAYASRDGNSYRAHLEHWPSNPLSKGSYTCYTPGQFTSVCGNEGKRVGNVLFAGEHANSFYEWQGFMEGACLSGLAAASEVLADLKRR